MSLEQGEKTLGINNWKFNQDGFKDGVRLSVCVCVCVRLCVSMHISQQKGYKIMSQEHLWVKKFLSSARVQNGGKKDTLGATIVNSASQFDFANNTQTN